MIYFLHYHIVFALKLLKGVDCTLGTFLWRSLPQFSMSLGCGSLSDLLYFGFLLAIQLLTQNKYCPHGYSYKGKVHGGAPRISRHSQLAISQYFFCVRFVFLNEQRVKSKHPRSTQPCSTTPEMTGRAVMISQASTICPWRLQQAPDVAGQEPIPPLLPATACGPASYDAFGTGTRPARCGVGPPARCWRYTEVDLLWDLKVTLLLPKPLLWGFIPPALLKGLKFSVWCLQ